MHKLILVDDDKLIHDSFTALFADSEVEVSCVDEGSKAVELVSKSPKDYPVIIMDYHLNGEKGSHFISLFKNINPDVIVFMLSGDLNRDVLREALTSGAKDFFEKGSGLEQTKAAVLDALNRSRENLKTTNDINIREENKRIISSIGLVGHSSSMASVAKDVMNASQHSYTVLILGESGTGKEMLAQNIANMMSGPFVAVNCAAYKDDLALMESELFGYEKGAFTGAEKQKDGLFVQAQNGVIFLDEVHELSLPAQLKLLRVIQEKKIRRVGGTKEIPLDSVKIVAAAKPDLKEKVDRGEFYIDLYTRLCVFPIEVPPLRERPEDIEILVDYFCKKYSKENGLDKKFLVTTVEKLKKMPWQGNVRELEHLVLRLVITSKENIITPNQLVIPTGSSELASEQAKTLKELKSNFEKLEKDLIARTLEANSRNQTLAARQLGIPLSTLQLRLKKHGLFHMYTKRSDAGTNRNMEH